MGLSGPFISIFKCRSSTSRVPVRFGLEMAAAKDASWNAANAAKEAGPDAGYGNGWDPVGKAPLHRCQRNLGYQILTLGRSFQSRKLRHTV